MRRIYGIYETNCAIKRSCVSNTSWFVFLWVFCFCFCLVWFGFSVGTRRSTSKKSQPTIIWFPKGNNEWCPLTRILKKSRDILMCWAITDGSNSGPEKSQRDLCESLWHLLSQDQTVYTNRKGDLKDELKICLVIHNKMYCMNRECRITHS